jgi:putative ABC transport system permease protein
MRAFTRVRSTLRSLFRKPELNQDLDEELLSIVELLAAEKIQAGMSPEQARREARLELGGPEQVKDRVREARLGARLDSYLLDARYAFRTLGKNPGFTAVAVLVLAIGIGATTALFSTIYSVLLGSVPFEAPERLVAGGKTRDGQDSGPVSRVDYFDYRELSQSFEQLAIMADFTVQHTVTGEQQPGLVHAGFVTWNLFPALRVSPVVGRGFLLEDETRGGASLTLISHGLWHDRFGGSPDAVGRTLTLDGTPLTIIGVMPRGFRFLLDADVWRLVDREGPFDTERDSHSHYVIGRLKPGVGLDQALRETDLISRRLAEQYPESNAGKGLWLTDLQSYMVQGVRPSLLLLMATTILVLLIACANVAGLLLARGEHRHPELAMRAALGASRRRLVRQLLTESVMLTTVAGLLGIGIAYLLQGVLLQLLPVGELGVGRPALSVGALGFTLLVAIATGLLIGVIPAFRSTGLRPAPELGSGMRSTAGLHSHRLRSSLVVVQVALSIALLVGSGLLMRSLAQLSSVELGFNPRDLLTAQLHIQAADYPTLDERNQFFTSLLEDVEALPGVESATLINKLPILSPWQDWGIWPAGQPSPWAGEGVSTMARWVPPGYFETMGIPLLAGRDISATDVAGAPYVVVLSETTSRTVFADANPIGRAVHIGWDDRAFQVVGMVADARVNTLRGAPDAAAYMSSAQIGATRLQMAVRTTVDPMLLVRPIDALLRRKDPNVLLANPASMASVVDRGLADFRIIILSLTLFAGVALVLAAMGLYGVLAYHVSQRANEIGIRLALGASSSDLLGMVLKRGLLLVGLGLLLGMAVAYPGMTLIRQLLFETRSVDPVAYLAAMAFLGVVAVLACLLPALRATRVNPVEVLRGE